MSSVLREKSHNQIFVVFNSTCRHLNSNPSGKLTFKPDLQDDKGEVNCALDIAVVGARHGAINRLVRTSNERLVAFDIIRNVSGAVPQRLLVEDAEGLVDTSTGILDLCMDGAELVVELPPIVRVRRGV